MMRPVAAVFLGLVFIAVDVNGRPFQNAFSTREQQERFLRAKGFDKCQGFDSGDEIDVAVGDTVFEETEKLGGEEEEEEDDESFRGDYFGSEDELDAVTFRNALRCFQKSVGLPETGVADEKTCRAMQDSGEEVDQKPQKGGNRKKRYAVVKQRWNRNHLTFFIKNYNVNRNLSQMTKEQFRQRIKEAFKIWTDVANLTVTERNSTDADIVIGFYSGNHHCPGRLAFQYLKGQLAHAFPPGSGFFGDIHINADERFRYETSPALSDGRSFRYVVLHEIGHALSLAHSALLKAVMWRNYPWVVPSKLSEDDIDGIRSIYGPKK